MLEVELVGRAQQLVDCVDEDLSELVTVGMFALRMRTLLLQKRLIKSSFV